MYLDKLRSAASTKLETKRKSDLQTQSTAKNSMLRSNSKDGDRTTSNLDCIELVPVSKKSTEMTSKMRMLKSFYRTLKITETRQSKLKIQ